MLVALIAGGTAGVGLLLHHRDQPDSTRSAPAAAHSTPTVTPAVTASRPHPAANTSGPATATKAPSHPAPSSLTAGSAVHAVGSGAPKHTKVKKAAVPVTYSAIAGRGCTSASASYDEYGFYTNGDAGWWTVGAGSWTGSGCNGEFTDMPMSGNAGADSDSGQAMIWGFKVGPRAQSCALKFYVPTSASARDVAASAAHVVVVHGTGLGNTAYVNPNGEHWMDQRSHHRSWLSLGTYPVHNGTIGVKLTNRGDPNGYPETFPHLAGGAVQIRCVAE